MKKTIISMVVMAMFAVLPASAQGIAFGVKGGANITKMSIDNDAIECKSGVGFFIGPTLKIDFLPFLGIQGSIFYEQANSKIEGEKIKRQSIIIPIDARVNLKFNEDAGIYLATGPQFGFNIGDKDKKFGADEWTMNSSTLSGNIGLGLILMDHLQISANYNIALGKTGEYKEQSTGDQVKEIFKSEGKSNAWQIALAYYF